MRCRVVDHKMNDIKHTKRKKENSKSNAMWWTNGDA